MPNRLPSKHKDIIALMNTLEISQCCLSWEICQDGPNGPDILEKEMMIHVETKDGGQVFLPLREFKFRSKQHDKLAELYYLLENDI